jgi:hypothetical protein
MTRIARDNLTYGLIALGCLALLFWIIPAQMPEYPGYGVPASVLPNVATGIMLVLSLLMLLRNALSHLMARPISPEEREYPEDDQKGNYSQVGRVRLWHLSKFIVPCALLMPAMQWLGFIPAGIAFMLLIQYLCGQRRPVLLLVVSVGSVLLVYAAMRYALGVPLP